MSQNRLKTQPLSRVSPIQVAPIVPLSAMQRIVLLASQQKLLPKLLYQLQSCCSSSKQKFHRFQKQVQNLYGHETRIPLKYNPEQAYTHRQKFRKKILQLQRKQIDIDYFQKLKTRQGNLHLYKGHRIQSIKYQTKKEYLIFKDFNQNKFRKSYTQIFDDKLQLKQDSLFRKNKKRAHTTIVNQQIPDYSSSLTKAKINQFDTQSRKQSIQKNHKLVKLHPIAQSVQLQKLPQVITKISQKFRPHLQNLHIGRMLNTFDDQKLLKKLIQIGSFPQSSSQISTICITKQSITKYFKGFYQKQTRLIEFLEIKPTLKFNDYKDLVIKFKHMNHQHILFMTFLFYDFNNDGYICDHDLRRIQNLYQKTKNTLIQQDYKLINAYKLKQIQNKLYVKAKNMIDQKDQIKDNSNLNKLQSVSNEQTDECKYLQLYKLPQITQTALFNWLQRRKLQNKLKQQSRQIQQNKSRQQSEQGQYSRQKMNLQQKQVKMKYFQVVKDSTSSHMLNPSILKYKKNFFEQKKQIQKYLHSIKQHKTYINYQQFKQIFLTRHIQKPQTKKYSYSIQSKRFDNKMILLNKSSVRYLKQPPNKINHSRKSRDQQDKLNCKPLLWYDIMFRIAGVKFQGLNYNN